jgi:hypothetical protein
MATEGLDVGGPRDSNAVVGGAGTLKTGVAAGKRSIAIKQNKLLSTRDPYAKDTLTLRVVLCIRGRCVCGA